MLVWDSLAIFCSCKMILITKQCNICTISFQKSLLPTPTKLQTNRLIVVIRIKSNCRPNRKLWVKSFRNQPSTAWLTWWPRKVKLWCNRMRPYLERWNLCSSPWSGRSSRVTRVKGISIYWVPSSDVCNMQWLMEKISWRLAIMTPLIYSSVFTSYFGLEQGLLTRCFK
jgi:hypothetical protein